MRERELRTVFTASNPVEAYFLKHLLESEGIEVYLFDEHISHLMPFSTGSGFLQIRLAVTRDDFEKAKVIVEDFKKYRAVRLMEVPEQ